MIMKLGEMVNVYGVLGEAKMNTLKVEEVLKAVKFRKAARPHVEGWNAFYKDIMEKAHGWADMTDEQKAELNKAMETELSKDIEITFDKLSEESVAGLIQENGFKVREIDLLGIMAE